MMVFKRIIVVAVVAFVAFVFGTFAYNFYRATQADPDPGIIFQRPDRPSPA